MRRRIAYFLRLPVLAGGKPKRLKPAEELTALSWTLAAGTATDEDKARIRKRVAAV